MYAFVRADSDDYVSSLVSYLYNGQPCVSDYGYISKVALMLNSFSDYA